MLRGALGDARRGLARRSRRSLLSGVGIALAAAMLSAALVIGVGLGGGFDRAAQAAGLPDMIVRFDPQSTRQISQRIAALPDVAGYSLRFEVTNARSRPPVTAGVMRSPKSWGPGTGAVTRWWQDAT